MTLEQLQAQLAAMPDPLDVPPRQFDAYEAKRSALRTRIHTVCTATATLAELAPQLAALTKWRDHLIDWRKVLCDRLLACPPQARVDHELGRLQVLKLSIMRIDRGLDLMGEMLPANLPLDDLMREAGYVPHDAVARARGEAWLGSMPSVEQRFGDLQRRHDDAQARLDAALRDE